jgi:hypothetical protein
VIDTDFIIQLPYDHDSPSKEIKPLHKLTTLVVIDTDFIIQLPYDHDSPSKEIKPILYTYTKTILTVQIIRVS